MRRVVVVGVTGSGKSTFARALSARLGVAYIEMDALYWQANWTRVAPEEFRARLSTAVAQDGWVADGNYSVARDIVWAAADTVVWLDYELPLIFVRLLGRTLRRTLRKEQLWGGNRERFLTQFLSRDSLFLWALQTHPRYRREFPSALGSPEFGHLAVIRLGTPARAEAWLAAHGSV
jgi:adenylate kinase family enzyme